MTCLPQLLGSYFHQDWPDEFADHEEAFSQLLHNESPDCLKTGLVELRKLLATDMSEAELQTVLQDDLGCAFAPASIGLDCRQWLMQLESVLADQLHDG